MLSDNLNKVEISNNPGKIDKSSGEFMNNETTNINTERVMLRARKKSSKPAGNGIIIKPRIKSNPKARSMSVFLLNIFITNSFSF
jgi:hypothetical protein